MNTEVLEALEYDFYEVRDVVRSCYCALEVFTRESQKVRGKVCLYQRRGKMDKKN